MGIFARVLREILEDHIDSDYSHLGGQAARTDPLWHPLRRLAIAPEVISRLKEAAESHDRRATLNPDDLEYLADQLRFTPRERERLRAALLAQGVEIFLRDRMAPGEGEAAASIADTVYAQLLSQFDTIYNRVRPGLDGTGDASAPDAQLALGLSIAERADAMVHALRSAQARGAAQEAQFWRRVAGVAFADAASVLRAVEPSLADEIEARSRRLMA